MIKKRVHLILLGFITILSFSQSAFAMRQPAMENSMRALENAERILNRALPNKGGHRVKALMHIRKAKQELKKGIDFANRRPAGGKLKAKKDFRDSRQQEQRNGFSQRRDERMMERDTNQKVRKKAVNKREKEYKACLRKFRGNSRRTRECERAYREGNERREERRERR